MLPLCNFLKTKRPLKINCLKRMLLYVENASAKEGAHERHILEYVLDFEFSPKQYPSKDSS